MSKLIYVENKAVVISDKLFEFMDQDEKRNAAEKENMVMEFIENFIMAISGDFLTNI